MRIDGGIVKPRALAVFRLITSSNFVGCSTGKSAGLGALEDLVHIGGGTSKVVAEARGVGHEAASVLLRGWLVVYGTL